MSRRGITWAACTELADILGRHTDVSLPSHYRLSNATTSRVDLEAIPIHYCRNSCVGYIGHFSSLERCPTCDEPRYISNVSSNRPVTTYKYIPIAPRLRFQYNQPARSRLLQQYRRQFDASELALGPPTTYILLTIMRNSSVCPLCTVNAHMIIPRRTVLAILESIIYIQLCTYWERQVQSHDRYCHLDATLMRILYTISANRHDCINLVVHRITYIP